MTKPISSFEFVAALVASGFVLPDHCARIVIDAPVGKAVKMYIECYADESILKVVSLAERFEIVREAKTKE